MEYYCESCNQYFENFSQLRKHKKIHQHKCPYCGQIFETGPKLGAHKINCKQNPKYEQIKQKRKENHVKGFKHTQQTKKKLSEIRIKMYIQHPQMHPWKNKNYSVSVPCQFIKQFLIDNGIHFYQQYSCPQEFNNRLYSIDIAFPNQKIAIEINGTRHYQKDGTLTPYFQQRHDIIENAMWKIYEIPYKKVYNEQFRESLLKLIKQNADYNFNYEQQIKEFFKQKESKYVCSICGGEKKTKKAKSCKECSKILKKEEKRNKIPSKQQLIEDKEELQTYVAIGRKYNKTDNAVRRWFKIYNIKN